MQKTADIQCEHGRQTIILPQDIHLPGEHVTVTQAEHTGTVTLTPVLPAKKETNWDEFFQLIAELGPDETSDFMGYREREKEFYADMNQEILKPGTLERFFQLQREVGPGEAEFLADRNTCSQVHKPS